MDEIKPPTPEELASEQEALKDIDEAEVRTQVIADLGLDETDDAEVIDKAVKREVKQRQITQSAIKQKIKYRDAKPPADKPPKEGEDPKPDDKKEDQPKPLTAEDVAKLATDAARKVRDEEFLDEQDLPDEIKDEIRRVAEIGKKTNREAMKDPYIVAKLKEHEAEDAAASNNHRTGKPKKFDPNTPPDVDMQTEEGRKAYDEWFEKAKAAGQ